MSKSKYMSGSQCNKKLWLEKHGREYGEKMSLAQQYIINQGLMIGERARDEFTNGLLIKSDNLHPTDALFETELALRNRSEILFEAAFVYEDCFVRVDILRRLNELEWELIEVKGTTKVKKEHIPDIAVQKYVLDNAGINIVKTSLMYLNKNSIAPTFHDLFLYEDLTNEVIKELVYIEPNLNNYKNVLLREDFPAVEVGSYWKNPYPCKFKKYCWEDINNTSIQYIPRLSSDKLNILHDMNIRKIDQIPKNFPLTMKQKEYIETQVSQNPDINYEAINESIDKLVYPIHFLDFETHNPALPKFKGLRPYSSIPFQFSCHILHSNGELEHKEFLASKDEDPRLDFLTSLLNTICEEGSIMVYSASFERNVLMKLASTFKEHENKVKNIVSRFWDLLVVFRNNYTHPGFLGSNSIKNVYPVLTKGKSYSDLDLNKGDEAGIYWEKMLQASDTNEITKYKTALVEYCKLDTFAMYDIFCHLKSFSNECNIPLLLEKLENDINNSKYLIDIKQIREFGGADVIISSRLTENIKDWLGNQPLVINVDYDGPEFIENRRRAIITKYSKELSWLLYSLRDIFGSYLNSISKYQFYGMLAIEAQNELYQNPNCSSKDLLLTTLNKGAWKYYLYNENIKNMNLTRAT